MINKEISLEMTLIGISAEDDRNSTMQFLILPAALRNAMDPISEQDKLDKAAEVTQTPIPPLFNEHRYNQGKCIKMLKQLRWISS